MSQSTIIDQLVVKLGLDPKDFKRGAGEIRKSFRELQNEGKGTAKTLDSAFSATIGKWFKAAAVVGGIMKVGGAMSDLSKDLRQLGIDSRNLGIVADELKAFQNVEEVMGGKSENLTRSFAGLQKSIYDLAYNGQISDSLIMLARMGVEFQDTAGNARDFTDIVLDAQKRIQELQQAGMTRANANNMLEQAGFSSGLAQAMLDGRVNPEMMKQRTRGAIAAANVDLATDWEKSATNRNQAGAAAGARALAIQAVPGTELNDKLAGAADLAAGTGGEQAQDLLNTWDDITETVGKAGKGIADAFDEATKSVEGWLSKVSAASQAGRDDLKNNPLNLKTGAGLNQFRHFDTPEQGILGAAEQLDRYRSGKTTGKKLNTISDIVATWAPESDNNPTGQYIKNVAQWTGIDANAQLKDSDMPALIAAMSRQEGRREVSLDDVVTILQTAAAGDDTKGIIGGETTVYVDRIEVNTQATDANGIAQDLKGALGRKTQAAQAERGQQ